LKGPLFFFFFGKQRGAFEPGPPRGKKAHFSRFWGGPGGGGGGEPGGAKKKNFSLPPRGGLFSPPGKGRGARISRGTYCSPPRAKPPQGTSQKTLGLGKFPPHGGAPGPIFFFPPPTPFSGGGGPWGNKAPGPPWFFIGGPKNPPNPPRPRGRGGGLAGNRGVAAPVWRDFFCFFFWLFPPQKPPGMGFFVGGGGGIFFPKGAPNPP